MKASREPVLPKWLARTLATVVIVIVLLMPIHAFISTWGGTAIGPLWLWKSWKEILLAIAGIATLAWVVWNRNARRIVLYDRLAQVIAAYAVLSFGLAVLNGPEVGLAATSAGLAMNLRYVVIAVIAYVLFRFAKWDWSLLGEKVLAGVVIVGVALSLLAILQVTLLPRDLLVPFGYDKDATIAPFMTIDANPDALRGFATLRGPNELGAFLIVPLLVAVLFIKRKSVRALAIVTIVGGLVASASRSAWVGAVLAIIALFTLTHGTEFLRSKRFIYGSILGACAFVVLVVSAVSVPALRLAIFRSSPGDTSLTEGSTDQHFLATAGGLERVRENPLGCGPGCAGPASYYGDSAQISENYYVQIAEEVGLAGLALWLAMVWVVVKRLYRAREDLLARVLLASFVGLSAIGLLLHVWVDDPLALTWWALAGAVLGYHASASRGKAVK